MTIALVLLAVASGLSPLSRALALNAALGVATADREAAECEGSLAGL